MMNLPEYVDEDEVKSMFAHADKDNNGYISYKEFTLMCKVPDQQPVPTTMPTGTTGTSTTTSMTGAVVSAVNGMLGKGGSTSTTASSSTGPVATVVTVTTSK